MKLKPWRGFPGKNGWNTAPVLVLLGEARGFRRRARPETIGWW